MKEQLKLREISYEEYIQFIQPITLQRIEKKRMESYARGKWMLPYTFLEHTKHLDTNTKQYFTDTIYGCKFIYDIILDKWSCSS